MSDRPSITFETGIRTVTGANFLVKTPAGAQILVDCGMVQGERFAMDANREPFGYDARSIQALIVTHAHLDHVGRIPKLVKEGYSGPVYSTPETRALAQLVLEDAAGIIAQESRQEGNEPIYNLDDVRRVFPQWKTIPYHQATKIADGISIFLKDAGHILGSAMVEVTIGEGDSAIKALFTGDLGNSPHPLLRDTEQAGDIDYVIMESVYGDRNHEPKEERLKEFERVIRETLDRGGTLVVPTFSIDRTQVLLYQLNNLVETGRIPSVPVFVDSPMAIKATEIYKSSAALFNDGAKAQIARGDDIFAFPKLQYTMSRGESSDIERMKGAKIILAGSGMSVGGRVISHEAKFLPDSKSTILFVGYQAAGSLGRELADGAKKVRINHETVKVKAHIETLFGYSAHRDSDHLVEFVASAVDDSGKGRLKRVFVAMGESGASMYLSQRLNDELSANAVVPEKAKEYFI